MWESLPPALQAVAMLGVFVGAVIVSVIYFRRRFNTAKSEMEAQLTERVTKLEEELKARTATEIEALKLGIETLEAWNTRQQATIQEVTAENIRLERRIEEGAKERRSLEAKIVTLQVDKSLLEGQLTAYKDMLNTFLRGEKPDGTGCD